MAGIPDMVKLVADLATYEEAVAAGKTSTDVMYLILAEKQVYFQGELWSKAPSDDEGDTGGSGNIDTSNLATKDEIIANEQVIAATFNDLNTRLDEDKSTYATKADLSDEIEAVEASAEENEQVIAATLVDLNSQIADNQESIQTNYTIATEAISRINDLSGEISENEQVVAASLTDINTRLIELAENLESLKESIGSLTTE